MKTYNAKGLTEVQIKFLDECEKLFLKNRPIDNQMLKDVFEATGLGKESEDRAACFEAWKYWVDLYKPYDRSSLIHPVRLDDIFNSIGKVQKPGMFYVSYKNSDGEHKSFYAKINVKYFEKLGDIVLIYDLTPNNFYFEVVNDILYLKYQSIIGSRCIAIVDEKALPGFDAHSDGSKFVHVS